MRYSEFMAVMDQLARTLLSTDTCHPEGIPTEIQVGRLGRIGFRRGWYAYAGSAFGPGGPAGRLGHHLRPVRKPHKKRK